jgi:protease-4
MINKNDTDGEILSKLAFATLAEQRRTRRWNIFFKSLFAAYFFVLIFIVYLPGGSSDSVTTSVEHTALVEIKGVISSETEANADTVISGLRAAFKAENAKGIILRINSPGGSPVQAGYINDEIYRLKKKYPKKKVYAVITDMCASGGYYIAAAADEIYADKASVVGSIGVLMNGFGFVDAMKKLGVERRLYTAGAHKGFLDPFTQAKPEDIKHIQGLLKGIHQQFIDTVRKGRGTRLKENDKLYSGLIWTGEESIKIGLVDALGSSSTVARDIIKAEKIVDYTRKPNFADRFAERLGIAFGTSVTSKFLPNTFFQ